jgi:hypothetical protein
MKTMRNPFDTQAEILNERENSGYQGVDERITIK